MHSSAKDVHLVHTKNISGWHASGKTSRIHPNGTNTQENGVRWTQLLRLPYYDCVHMMVADLMHNLLLGLS